MSNLLITGVAGAFGLAFALFIATSVLAVPFLAVKEVRARRR
jgi:hypothetical protein